jgi:hypothetical protein
MFVPKSMNQPRGRDGKLTVLETGSIFEEKIFPFLHSA